MSDDNNDEDTPEPPPLLGRGQAVPRRRWTWLLPSLLAVAVVSLLAVTITAIRHRGPSPQAKVIGHYLDKVESGDTTKAYAVLCDRFRRATSFDEFQRILTIEKREAGQVTKHSSAQVRTLGPATAVASYTVRRSDGEVVVDAALVKERGNWRVCGFKTRGRVTTTTGP